jgi:hypothetical protein
VGSVAEWDIRGMSTAAKGDGRPSGKTETLAFLIHDLEISLDANGTIAENRYFCTCHECLRENALDLSAFTR